MGVVNASAGLNHIAKAVAIPQLMQWTVPIQRTKIGHTQPCRAVMAELAVLRALFADILRRTDRLRPRPPLLAARGSGAMNDANPSR